MNAVYSLWHKVSTFCLQDEQARRREIDIYKDRENGTGRRAGKKRKEKKPRGKVVNTSMSIASGRKKSQKKAITNHLTIPFFYYYGYINVIY